MKKVKNTYLITELEEIKEKISSTGLATGLILELEDGTFWSAFSTSQVSPFEQMSDKRVRHLLQPTTKEREE